MADKDATIKLTLKTDGFKSGLRAATGDAKNAGTDMGKGISDGLSKAGQAGIDALKSSLSSLKSAVMGIAGLAGGLGFAEMARAALTNESAFRKMAFQIKAGTGEMVNWRDLQKDAQKTALDTGHTTEEIARSTSQLFQAIGDPKFARAVTKTVAEAATGAHESIETMTALAGGLNEKFGITADQMGDTLASVVALGNKGGVSVEDLAGRIDQIGANAKVAGIQGQAGFQTMVAWLNVADNATGNLKKGISGVSGIIDSIAAGTVKEPMLKHLGLDLDSLKKSGATFDDIIGKILTKTGGKSDKLAQVFSGDQLKVITEIGKTFASTFDETKGDVKTKTAAALDAFHKTLTEAGKSNLTYKDLQEEAAKELETPEMRVKRAMEELAQAFTKPEIVDALKKLADFIPKIVKTMMDHPLLTGAFLSGVPQAVAGSLIKSILGGLGGLLGGGKNMGGQAGLALGAGALLGGFAGNAFNDWLQLKSDQSEKSGVDVTLAAGNTLQDAAARKRLSREQLQTAIESNEAQKQELEDRLTYARGVNDASGDLKAAQDRLATKYGSLEVVNKLFGGDRDNQSNVVGGLADFNKAGQLLREEMDKRTGARGDTGENLEGAIGGMYTYYQGRKAEKHIGMMSDDLFNLGAGRTGTPLGGLPLGALSAPAKSLEERRAEEARAAEEAKAAQQKQANADLANAIGKNLTGLAVNATIMNPDAIGKAGNPPGPTPH